MKLAAAMLAVFVLTVALSLALQAYLQGAKVVARSKHRTRATAVAESKLEELRAQGYSRLPAGRVAPVSSRELEGLPGGRGEVRVSRGDSNTLKRVEVAVSWVEPGGERQSVRLVSLMSAHGMDP